MENFNITFPQANQFERVIAIMSLEKSSDLQSDDILMSILDNITYRQVQYYLSACEYLGLINDNRTYTEMGEMIRNLSYSEKIIQLARVVIADPIIGTVYLTERLHQMEMSVEEIAHIISKYYQLSDAVYRRRAQTVVSWLRWLKENFQDTEAQ